VTGQQTGSRWLSEHYLPMMLVPAVIGHGKQPPSDASCCPLPLPSGGGPVLLLLLLLLCLGHCSGGF